MDRSIHSRLMDHSAYCTTSVTNEVTFEFFVITQSWQCRDGACWESYVPCLEGEPGPRGGLYNDVQCIMGNGHPQTDRQTPVKTLLHWLAVIKMVNQICNQVVTTAPAKQGTDRIFKLTHIHVSVICPIP